MTIEIETADPNFAISIASMKAVQVMNAMKATPMKAVQAMKAVKAMKAMKVKKVYFTQNPAFAGYSGPVIPARGTVADMNRRRVEQEREKLAMY